jgi:hypothetical protein
VSRRRKRLIRIPIAHSKNKQEETKYEKPKYLDPNFGKEATVFVRWVIKFWN